MFNIPLKQSQQVDWSGPLRSYLARMYGSSAEFGNDAAAMQTLRQDALGAATNIGGRDILYRYYVQLENLSLRIPINEGGCKVQFSWQDLYDKHEISQYSVAFEKAAILFNLAATLFTIGIETENNKTGFAAFQAAAGIYKLISENFIHAPSADFEADTTQCLYNLSMAHAQTLFIFNGIEKIPPSLLYKVAQGAATFYKESAEGLERLWAAKSWGEKVWTSQVQFAAAYWNALSHYHYALYLDSSDHGAAIAYMTEAKSLFTKILDQHTSKFAASKDVQAYKELSSTKLKGMVRDNDLLYHVNVPPVSGQIAHTIAAKPLDIDKIMPAEEMERVIGRELFANVLPLEVHETASMYSEELAKMSRNEQEVVEIANQELNSALSYLDLPHSARLLLNPEQEDNVPDAVLEWSREVNESDIPLSFVFPKKNQVLSLIATFPPSASAEAQKLKASIVHASQQDETLESQYDSIKVDLMALKDHSLLSRQFSRIGTKPAQQSLIDFDVGSGARPTEQIEQVLEMYEKLRKIEKERKIVYTELRQRLFNDDISSQLVANRKTMKPQDIFENEKQKFQPFVSRIASTRNRQRTLLSDMTSVWKSILSHPAIKEEAQAREQHINSVTKQVDRYRIAYQTWLGLVQGIKQANEYYDQLLQQAQQIHGRSLDLSSLSSNLPPVPARPQAQAPGDVNAYSVPSVFNNSLYDRPPAPPPK